MLGFTCMLLCGSSCVCISRSGPRVPPAPGLPCALEREGGEIKQSSGEMRRENAKAYLQCTLESLLRRPLLRHCERSEAIQNLSAVTVWIASLRSQ
ncbi:hypothetical protein [Bradyrhizobium glycinis]|uniref:hypothetical protein n=1 Tax=Bradyrhizobium glycinis TaxID=2751812 RepID=UPI0018D62F68|nr:hypothetical protein [Bradyrhizobium glycinis]MBH5367762.1 hypothetical protein [Bradyrhizobium glycinis]